MSQYRETLVSKDGREVVSTSPGTTNDLVYGQGYKVKKKSGSGSGRTKKDTPKAEPSSPQSTPENP